MSWKYKQSWPVASGGEILAGHFEDIRQHIWAASQSLNWYKNNGTDWSVGDTNTFSATFHQVIRYQYTDYHMGYRVGDMVMYDGEVWVSNTNFPAHYEDPVWIGDNTVPSKLNSGWKLGAHYFNYRHYDHNAERYIGVEALDDDTYPFNRVLIKASEVLPRQVRRDTQVFGAVAWQPYNVCYDKALYSYNDVNYLCNVTHATAMMLDASKFTRISASRAINPSQLDTPVEFAWRYITGAIGAVFPHLGERQTWTPSYYGYYMNRNTPASVGGKYANPKMAEAYQAAVELVASYGGWYFAGPPGGVVGTSSENDYIGHRGGDGFDPSGTFNGDNARGNFHFNKSCFEECLYKYGTYDWYLDLINPPTRSLSNPQNNSLACWRRTWRYAMDYPYGVGQTRNWYQIQMTGVPANESKLKIGDYQFVFLDQFPWSPPEPPLIDGGSFRIYSTYAEVAIGGGMGWGSLTVTQIMTNLCDAITASGRGSAQQYGQSEDVLDRASITTIIQDKLTFVGSAKISIRTTDTFGGVTLMWPAEWGNPPEPPIGQTWRQYEAVAAIIDKANERWKANPDFRAEMEERHTGVFRPANDGWKPELAVGILNDMKGVLAFLKDTSENIGPVVWSCYHKGTEQSAPRHFKNFSDAAACFASPGGTWEYGESEWEAMVVCGGSASIFPYRYPYNGDYSWGYAFGYRGYIGGGFDYDSTEEWPSNYHWWVDVSNMPMPPNPLVYSLDKYAYGLRTHVPVSDFFWSRFKDRTLRVKMYLHPWDWDRGGQVYDRYAPSEDGFPPSLTGAYRSNIDESGKYGCACFKMDIHNNIDVPTTDSVYFVDLPIVHNDDMWNPASPWFEIKPKFGFGFYAPGKWPDAQYGNAAECFAMCAVSFGGGAYNPLLDIDPMDLPITESFDITI